MVVQSQHLLSMATVAKHDHPPDKKPAVSLEDCTKGHVLDGVLEDGTLPGDHGGAGGMDSSLFL